MINKGKLCCSKMMAQRQLMSNWVWQPLSNVEHWNRSEAVCCAVEKCYSFIVPGFLWKKGGLCRHRAVPHVVYQPRRTAGHPDTVFSCLACALWPCSCLIKHDLISHKNTVLTWHHSLILTMPWKKINKKSLQAPSVTFTAQPPRKAKHFGFLDPQVEYFSSRQN